jgi:hypothetical protein
MGSKKRARKTKRAGKTERPSIRVESSWVSVVPLAHMRSYFDREIEREGYHRSGCEPVVICPREEAGAGTQEWVEHIFASLDHVRQTYGDDAFEIAGLLSDGRAVDVGLIDVPVIFKGDLEVVKWNLGRRPMKFLDENLRHIDWLFAGTLHDQMTLATVLHVVLPDGSPCIHYHNLVFALRREFRPGQTLVGPLDLSPMLDALTRRLKPCVVAGQREGVPSYMH